MKFSTNRPYANPEKAARKLLEIANATEAPQEGRIYIETSMGSFLFIHGCSPAEYGAGLAFAIERGWLWRHEWGTYVSSPRPALPCARDRKKYARRNCRALNIFRLLNASNGASRHLEHQLCRERPEGPPALEPPALAPDEPPEPVPLAPETPALPSLLEPAAPPIPAPPTPVAPPAAPPEHHPHRRLLLLRQLRPLARKQRRSKHRREEQPRNRNHDGRHRTVR